MLFISFCTVLYHTDDEGASRSTPSPNPEEGEERGNDTDSARSRSDRWSDPGSESDDELGFKDHLYSGVREHTQTCFRWWDGNGKLFLQALLELVFMEHREEINLVVLLLRRREQAHGHSHIRGRDSALRRSGREGGTGVRG